MGFWEDLGKSVKKKAGEVTKKAFKQGKEKLSDIKEHPFKTLAKETEPGKLVQAFDDMLSKDSLKTGKLAEGIVALSNSDKQVQGSETRQYNPADTGFDLVSAFTFGLATGHEQGGRMSSAISQNPPEGNASNIISEPKQEFIRQNQPMQYTPGSEGSAIGGQGEVMPGYGMQSPQSSIPPQYMDMARLAQSQGLAQGQPMARQNPMIPSQYQDIVQSMTNQNMNNPSIQGQPMQQLPQQQLAPGAFAGMKEGILGMPSSAYGQDYQGQEGRETAYYAGKLIPDIIRSKLGINTTGEEARQQQTIETSKRSVDREGRKIENQDLARANQLRKEFIDRPEIKDYMLIKNKAGTMDALLNDALSGNQENKVALDQGLITLFNKITDPTSVVRESEYARTPANLPIVNRFNGAFAKLQTGGAGLTDDDRKALVWGAKIMANQAGTMFNERASQYSDIAMSYGVDPQLVIAGVGEYKPYSKQPEYSQQLQDNQIQAGWTQDKEVRYQELLKKRGR